MLGLGMASAHAPMMFQKSQYWPRMLERIPPEAREQLPTSARLELASPTLIEGYIRYLAFYKKQTLSTDCYELYHHHFGG